MPSKKKKYNARFPAGRIKKIMQTDEEVGKVAQAVPVIISRTLELFVESLLTKTLRITNARNAKTLSPSHMKQCIISESRFDFLRDLVKNIPDIGVNEEQLSGSETGYEATTTGAAAAATPSSSSTSPSNGGSDSMALPAQPSAGTSSLQRSESYTPASSSSSSCGAVNYAGTLPVKAPIQPPTQQQQQGNHLKRAMNHVGFYKEISLDESGSSSSSSSSNSSSASREPPPPKLTRLHSAPAGGANIVVAATSTTTKASPSIPFKIDILPTLPAAASGSQPRGAPATAPASSSNYKITYKFEPLKEGVSQSPKVTSAVNQHQQQHQPVFKLDYSNVKLPMTASNSSAASAATTRHHHPLQPTIKIDLSGISNYGTSSSNPSPSVASSPSGVAVKSSVPATPSTPLSAASSSSGVSSNSSSGSGSRNPYIFSTGSAAAAGSSSSSSSSSVAAPVYSSVSSSIPGMDEDYDDI